MTSAPGSSRAANLRTLLMVAGLVVLVGFITWPSLLARIHYSRVRSELRAIRDAAAGAELKSVGKLFTTLARVVGPTVVNVTSKRRILTIADEIGLTAPLGQARTTSSDTEAGVTTCEISMSV